MRYYLATSTRENSRSRRLGCQDLPNQRGQGQSGRCTPSGRPPCPTPSASTPRSQIRRRRYSRSCYGICRLADHQFLTFHLHLSSGRLASRVSSRSRQRPQTHPPIHPMRPQTFRRVADPNPPCRHSMSIETAPRQEPMNFARQRRTRRLTHQSHVEFVTIRRASWPRIAVGQSIRDGVRTEIGKCSLCLRAS